LPISAQIIRSSPLHACTPLLNGLNDDAECTQLCSFFHFATHVCSFLLLASASVKGRIVLVVRGKCTFDQKREIIRNAGGVAMLVANTQVLVVCVPKFL
jgi:hypothetical protein